MPEERRGLSGAVPPQTPWDTLYPQILTPYRAAWARLPEEGGQVVWVWRCRWGPAPTRQGHGAPGSAFRSAQRTPHPPSQGPANLPSSHGGGRGRWPPAQGASPGSSSGSPGTGAATAGPPPAGASGGSSSRRARRAASGSEAGPAASPVRAQTTGCLHPAGAPATGTGGAGRTGWAPEDPRAARSLARRPHSRHWRRPAGEWAGSWGLRPAGRSRAGWCSRRCGSASWRQQSRPWSPRGARGTGSGPARPAPTGSGSVACWAGPGAAPSSP